MAPRCAAGFPLEASPVRPTGFRGESANTPMTEPKGASSWDLQHSFPSDPRLVRQERHFVVNVCRLWGMADRKREELALAVTELLNNSVEHGSNGPGLVRLSMHVDASRVVVRISDEGKHKLDPAMLKQAIEKGPGKPDDTQFRGRGLFLVHALVDEFRVVNGESSGNTLEVVKRL
jgi:anti-sigma regulatory factor (Ser/Thr protein kinase)